MDTLDRMRRRFEVEEFYYEEAAMLDERRYRDWLALFTDDAHYWMPIRRTTTAKETGGEFSSPDGMAYFDDDRATLEIRVRKLESGYSWSEDPPSRTRRFITNVRVLADLGHELTVECNFHLYRTRLESDVDSWIGLRRDVLRRVGGSFRIAGRKIFLDQTVLFSRNLSSFF
jgi:biphenyl 2,3-dioxygenase beta subunit